MIPVTFALHQNFPNPFNPITILTYDLPIKNHITLIIYDLNGRKVKVLFNEIQSAGKHSIEWDGKNEKGESVSAGMYIYTLKTLDHILKKKMIVLK